MSGWGIGLGGFTTGLDNGIKTGVSIANLVSEKKDRELREQHLKVQEDNQAQELDLRKKVDARAQQQFDEQEKDRQRTQGDENDRRALFAKGSDAYNSAVANGTAKPNDAYDYFAHDYAPHIEQFYLAKGDVQNAANFHKWSQDTNTQQQIRDMGKLIGTYHDAVATGDFDPLKNGLTKFYNDLPADVTGGNQFTDLNVTKDDKGNVTAVQGVYKTADGKTVTQNFGDLGQFQTYLQGVANPASLYEHTMASAQQAQKFTADLNEYAAKKKIDIGEDQTKHTLGLVGKTPQERYNDAYSTLQKNSLDGKAPTDAQVRAYLAQQDAFAQSNAPGLGGTPQPAPSPVIVDTKTGQPVGNAGGAAPLSASSPAPPPSAVTAPRPGGASGPATSAPPQSIPNPQNGTTPQPFTTGLGGAPQYPTTSTVDVGAKVMGALRGKPISSSAIDQINAARKATGKPPLTADEMSQILKAETTQQQANATPPGAPQPSPAEQPAQVWPSPPPQATGLPM